MTATRAGDDLAGLVAEAQVRRELVGLVDVPATTPVAIDAIGGRIINQGTVALQRVGVADRSFVRKVVRAPRPGDETGPFATTVDPTHWNYWRREVDLYADGVLRRLPGLSTPHALQVVLHDGAGTAGHDGADGAGTASIWLEHLDGPPADEWSPDGVATVAAGFGDLHAAALAGDLAWVFDLPSVSRGWPPFWTGEVPAGVLDDDAAWAGAAGHGLSTEADRDLLRQAAARRAELLGRFAGAETVPCHFDARTANLGCRASAPATPVVLDWSMLGGGPLLLDAVEVAWDSAWMFGRPTPELPDLSIACRDAYLDALGPVAGTTRAELERRHAAGVVLGFGVLLAGVVRDRATPGIEAVLRDRYGIDGAEVLERRAGIARAALAHLHAVDA